MNEEEEEEEERGGKYKNPLYIIHCNFCGYRGSKGEINDYLIFFGVYKHKNFLRSVNVYENKFMVPNERLFVYLERKLGANK